MSTAFLAADKAIFWLAFVPAMLVVATSVASRAVGWRPPVLVLRRWIEGRP